MNNSNLPYDFQSDDFHEKVIEDFDALKMSAFHYQYDHIDTYRNFCDSLNKGPDNLRSAEDIPFLPIEFFKYDVICDTDEHNVRIFKSSGTGGERSKHFVPDTSLYLNSIERCFKSFYGNIALYNLLALLPSYQEQKSSSLIYMTDHLISKAKSGDYSLHDQKKLFHQLEALQLKKEKVLLIGVSFALLDLAESVSIDLSNCIVMETGGMKGRREEITRAELHEKLKIAFNLSHIHSEYSMTELLSQAYSNADGLFKTPPWMQVSLRDIQDPLSKARESKSGAINIVDLANIHSCCFIATQDIGRIHTDNTFEVLGRLDNSDIRGCNLMFSE
ncbi:MAG: acyl transferase [Bacteroidia bacterium]|nr:acyl transferase [Bacteroidia bacterium]